MNAARKLPESQMELFEKITASAQYMQN